MAYLPLNLKLIRLLLRPIVRMLIRHGHGFSEVVEALRGEFVDVAIKDLEKEGHDINVSRLSAVTGIGRREVSKVIKSSANNTQAARVAARVIGMWQNSNDFKDKNGTIKDLTINGTQSEFFSLVETITKDINPYTLLFELLRSKVVVKINEETIRLIKTEFIPSQSPEQGLELLSSDLDDFIVSVDENIYSRSQIPNLHLKTEYTAVRDSAIPQIEEWLVKEGSLFHSKARDFISQFDIDINPVSDQQTGVDKGNSETRVVLGTFSRIVNKTGK